MLKLLFISLQSSHTQIFVSVEKELKNLVHFPVSSTLIHESNPRVPLLKSLFNVKQVRHIKMILESESPDLLIVGNDGGINATYLKVAKLLGIPTLVIQDGVLVNAPQKGPLNLFRWKNHLLWHTLSKVSEIQLVAKLLTTVGLRNRVLDWGVGQGNTIVVMGDRDKRILSSRGVPENKLVLTGSPLFDKSVLFASKFDRLDVCKKLGVGENERFVLFLTQPFVEDGVWTEQMNNELIASVAVMPNSFNSLIVVIKVHPRENIEKYEKLLNGHNYKRIVLVKDFDLDELVLLSDAVLTVNSTAGLVAGVHKKPLVLLDYFHDCSTGLYEEIGTKAKDSGHLQSVLNQILLQRENAESLPLNDSSLKEFLGELDGKASRRVADVILSMVGS